MSFKPQVQTIGGGDAWNGNGLAFATKAEAEQWAKDLEQRWILVTATRALESDEVVNCRIVDGVVHHGIEETKEN